MSCAVSDEILRSWLMAEAPFGDLTTRSLGLGALAGTLVLASRAPMTVCATEDALRVFELAGAHGHVLVPSGQHVHEGVALLSASGPMEALLQARGVAQAVCEFASGVASEAARIVTELRAAGHVQPLACRCDAVPGQRALLVKAVRAGGGTVHRLGLSDSLLVQAEHRVFIEGRLDEAMWRIRRHEPERKLVVEATSLEDALMLAQAGAEVLHLMRFTPEAVRQTRVALHQSRLHPLLAVDGGVHAGNAVAFAQAGADVLVSAAPCQAPPREVEVRVTRDVSVQ